MLNHLRIYERIMIWKGNVMDKKTAICNFLREFHTGKEKAVCSKELQRIFSLDGRNIRRKVSKLRQAGYPICSDETGYYYADNQTEINATIGRLNGLVTSVSNARTGLLYAVPNRPIKITTKIG